MIDLLRKIEEIIFKTEKYFLILVLILMVVFGFTTIITRNFIGRDFIWIGDFLQNAVLWLAFIGGSMASRYNKQININLFPIYLQDKPELQKKIEAIISIFVVIVAGFLCWSAYTFVKMEYDFGEDLPSSGIKLWTVTSVLIYVFVMICFRYFLRFLEIITGRALPVEHTQAKDSVNNEIS